MKNKDHKFNAVLADYDNIMYGPYNCIKCNECYCKTCIRNNKTLDINSECIFTDEEYIIKNIIE